ncbi:MFS transporter [Streptomyces armeniacus]|uniref:MFS transporter n=1 Tax=Streptomyces armeniacus TaxID=83291 RepID=A0A345XY15_9ACTN|nr:MFS transporter [Streptomyces armeniacus]
MSGVDWRFRALAAAYAVSAYGNYLNLIALSLFSYEVTDSAFGVGATMALRLFSGFLAGLASGALLGRATRRTVMICTDAAQAGAMAVLALFATDTPLWLLGAAVVVLGAGNTFFSVALRSAVPVLVGHESRAGANGLLVTARSVATVLGFASAAPVIGFGGFGTAFAVNAASFVVCGAVVVLLRPRTDSEGEDGGDGGDGGDGAHACGVERRRTHPSSAARSSSDRINSAFGRPIRATRQPYTSEQNSRLRRLGPVVKVAPSAEGGAHGVRCVQLQGGVPSS